MPDSASPDGQQDIKPQRAPSKRGARACAKCRSLKKTCIPGPSGEAPCTRCANSGAPCIFDRPSSSVVDDAGLTRLSTIETTLSSQELRLDTLVNSVGNLQGSLLEIMSMLRTNRGSPASAPLPHHYHHPPILPGAHHTSPRLHPAPNPPSLPAFHPPARRPSSVDASSPHSANSRLEALASLASQPSPESHVDRFAARLHAPIQALADAAEEIQSRASATEAGDGTSAEERPRKRSRIGLSGVSSPAVKESDVVAKGIVSDKDARALVKLWLKELQPFCHIIDPLEETYDSLRRNRFLFDVIIHTALRAQGGSSPPTKELIAVAEQTRTTAQQLIFDSSPPKEVIEALLVMSCYHDEPYLLSGYTMRLALASRMDTTFEQIDEHGWDQTDDRAKHLTVQLRIWLYLVFLEFKHSRSTGRLLLLRQDDIDFLDKNADRLLTLPYSITDDERLVANLKLTFIERQIILKSRAFRREDPIELRVAYVHQMREVLVARHQVVDARMAVKFPSPTSWTRRSQLRHHSESIMFLAANVFGEILLEPNGHPEVQQIAHETLIAARSVVRTVIQSDIYTASVKYCGFLFKVDLSFAALLTLKLAQLLPHSVDGAEVIADVERVTDLFADTAGSQRYSAALRFTRDQYLASLAPTPDPSVPTPLPQLRTEDSALPSEQWPQWFTAQQLDVNGSIGRALLPGEMEIDWTNVPTSFLESSEMFQGNDWLQNGFPDMSWMGSI